MAAQAAQNYPGAAALGQQAAVVHPSPDNTETSGVSVDPQAAAPAPYQDRTPVGGIVHGIVALKRLTSTGSQFAELQKTPEFQAFLAKTKAEIKAEGQSQLDAKMLQLVPDAKDGADALVKMRDIVAKAQGGGGSMLEGFAGFADKVLGNFIRPETLKGMSPISKILFLVAGLGLITGVGGMLGGGGGAMAGAGLGLGLMGLLGTQTGQNLVQQGTGWVKDQYNNMTKAPLAPAGQVGQVGQTAPAT